MKYICKLEWFDADNQGKVTAQSISDFLVSCREDGLNIDSLKHKTSTGPGDARLADYSPEGIEAMLRSGRLRNPDGTVNESTGADIRLWFDDDCLTEFRGRVGSRVKGIGNHFGIDFRMPESQLNEAQSAWPIARMFAHFISYLDPDVALLMPKPEFFRERRNTGVVGQRLVDYVSVERGCREEIEVWLKRFGDAEHWVVDCDARRAVAVNKQCARGLCGIVEMI